jgi:hypothetical protein
VRDPAKNEPYIKIGREEHALQAFDIQRDRIPPPNRPLLTGGA